MREMGTVELLTREGEIKIARRIENGLNHAMSSLARYPDTMRMIFERYNEVRKWKPGRGDRTSWVMA